MTIDLARSLRHYLSLLQLAQVLSLFQQLLLVTPVCKVPIVYFLEAFADVAIPAQDTTSPVVRVPHLISGWAAPSHCSTDTCPGSLYASHPSRSGECFAHSGLTSCATAMASLVAWHNWPSSVMLKSVYTTTMYFSDLRTEISCCHSFGHWLPASLLLQYAIQPNPNPEPTIPTVPCTHSHTLCVWQPLSESILQMEHKFATSGDMLALSVSAEPDMRAKASLQQLKCGLQQLNELHTQLDTPYTRLLRQQLRAISDQLLELDSRLGARDR